MSSKQSLKNAVKASQKRLLQLEKIKALKVDRNSKGQYIKGNSGNPFGAPVGHKKLTTLLREALQRVAEGTGIPEDIAIVNTVIERAKNGDMQAVAHIWDRTEGKAIQQVDVTSQGQSILVMPAELIQKNNNVIEYRDTIESDIVNLLTPPTDTRHEAVLNDDGEELNKTPPEISSIPDSL